MSTKVSVDTERLRAAASALAETGAKVRDASFDAGDLGSSRMDWAFTGFERYWSAGRSALAQSEDALVTVLRSAADGATRRDAESAQSFGGSLRAF